MDFCFFYEEIAHPIRTFEHFRHAMAIQVSDFISCFARNINRKKAQVWCANYCIHGMGRDYFSSYHAALQLLYIELGMKMKKQMLAVLIGAVMAVPMIAAAQGAYVGVNAVKNKNKLTLEDDGSFKDTSTNFKLYGGYNFNQNFGLEGGYADLGKGNLTFVDGADTTNFKVKGHSFYFAATGTLPLNEQFSLFAKAGLSFNRVKLDATENGVFMSSQSYNRTSPLIGVGASYKFSKEWSVVAEYENYGKTFKEDGDHIKTSGFSIGARYSF